MKRSEDFFVVKNGSTPGNPRAASIGGFRTCKYGWVCRHGELRASRIRKLFFFGTGCVSRRCHMVLQDNAQPSVQPARRVPLALREPLKTELQRMVKHGIIEKVDEPTDWVSPLVIVRKKDGTLRVCLDPRRINWQLKREHYQLSRREDIEAELRGAQFFTTLDAKAGSHQIPLDNDTSRICTFGSPFGRYKFLRLLFGIASAPEVFLEDSKWNLRRSAGCTNLYRRYSHVETYETRTWWAPTTDFTESSKSWPNIQLR